MNKDYASLFKALSDDNRLTILKLLIQGETCGCTLIDKLPNYSTYFVVPFKNINRCRHHPSL